MIHLPTPFDRLIEDIALAGEQLTAMAACEGAAGNISVFTAALACPLDAVEEAVVLPRGIVFWWAGRQLAGRASVRVLSSRNHADVRFAYSLRN
jgi:hypothetical protein